MGAGTRCAVTSNKQWKTQVNRWRKTLLRTESIASPTAHPSGDITHIAPSAPAQHLAREQFYKTGCGAVSLLCAAKELGVTHLPAYRGSLSERKGINTLELNLRCETDLLKITSGSTTYPKQQSDMNLVGFTMPDGIVTAARMLGLDVRAEENPGVFSKALNWIYPDARMKLSGMGCPIEHCPIKIEPNQIKIEALAVSVVGVPVSLHWVVHRSDGSYMNPDTGTNHKNFEQLNADAKQAICKMLGYYKTGISLIVSRPS